MAFASASGYNNLPNGNFSPVIYSQKVQKAFRKNSVVEDVTNTDYMGEIANYGDSVKIIKEPDITINKLERGTSVAKQDLSDADFSLIIDQAQYFMFSIDDIEAAHSHVNFMDLATDRAAYKLSDHYDREVLGYLSGYVRNTGDTAWIINPSANGTKADSGAGSDELLVANKLDITDFGGSDLGGSADADTHALTSVPLAAGGGSGAITSPLAVLNRMARKMDEANVDQDGRWFVADPVFYELLMDENSKFINNDFAGGQDAGDVLRNGKVVSGLIRGFRVYKSNNLPFFGTGPGTTASAGSEENFGVVVSGHDSAIATAQQLAKTESYRDTASFADIVRGMQLYGRKILRPEAIMTANYNLA
tara:strand:+ start:2054 stop:3142 length:1089 start_codon:yes stop_codon:yes gene_type:complete